LGGFQIPQYLNPQTLSDTLKKPETPLSIRHPQTLTQYSFLMKRWLFLFGLHASSQNYVFWCEGGMIGLMIADDDDDDDDDNDNDADDDDDDLVY
jgi:hypothetical protein